MKIFLKDLSIKQEKYNLHYDSQSAINLNKNSIYLSRSKHIDVCYHWIRDALENLLMQIVKIDTSRNLPNMMTKPLSKEKHELCRSLAGMILV